MYKGIKKDLICLYKTLFWALLIMYWILLLICSDFFVLI